MKKENQMGFSEEFNKANYSRYRIGQQAGHYESFFQRANHPTRPVAFWIRYTIFSPENHPEEAIGELWAIYFDGETASHVAVRKELPLDHCIFEKSVFSVEVDDAVLKPGILKGSASSGGHNISWNLDYYGMEKPLFLLPQKLYKMPFPKAKLLVGLPMATYNGLLTVDDKSIDIENWMGSQNHNWGVRHTDHYAWGQVAGFDTHPDSFLEVATARIKIGPFCSPFMTPIVLRHNGQEIAFNTIVQSLLRAKGSFCYFVWTFCSKTKDFLLEGTISAPKESFVGLIYSNPPGGVKHCLNTKIAACELKLFPKRQNKLDKPEIFFSQHGAAFEILTDDTDHGVNMLL
jgi:hypothetical protein